MIVCDTSVVVDALTGQQRSLPALMRAIDRGERVILSAIVIYEWLRGPRTSQELSDRESLFPASRVVPFENADAEIAARLYRSVGRARAREVDIAIAACAIRHDAPLWTLNAADFKDIPGLLFHAKA